MNPRDWIIVAFTLATMLILGVMMLADVQVKRDAAQASMAAVRQSLTTFERDERDALDKLRRIYGRGK